jgi:hypothetical protein
MMFFFSSKDSPIEPQGFINVENQPVLKKRITYYSDDEWAPNKKTGLTITHGSEHRVLRSSQRTSTMSYANLCDTKHDNGKDKFSKMY